MAAQLVEIRFKGNRKAYYRWPEPEPLRAEEPVIVETDRGLDLGHVSATGPVAATKCERCALRLQASTGANEGGERPDAPAPAERGAATPSEHAPAEPERRVVRRATTADTRVADELRKSEDDVRRRVRERVKTHHLDMKVSDTEWQWDRNRLTVYFTAERRVDFRNLVRDLASLFRTRIELRQIGVRDEAKRLDGIGRCGRQLCCTWLPELRPIGLQIAKDQRLSLNPTQISGACGRLLCCLRYEHDFYVQSRKRFPKEGKVLVTSKGNEKVASLDIFRERVTLRSEDGSARTVPLADLKREVEGAGAPAALAPPPATPPPPPPPAPAAPTAPAAAAPATAAGPERRRGAPPGRAPPGRRRHPVSRFYLTTAIDYANGEPHFGHALEKIGADAIARYHRLRGDDVHFLIGMDEHGQKVAQSAQEHGVEPQQLVDGLAEAFRAMWQRLGISYDQFIRTTDPGHQAGVRALIERIFARRPDDLYERAYEGWYCVGCETFKRDDEIVDGKCVLHQTRTLAWSAERNWFFRLSAYAPFVERLLRERPAFLQPESRRNEILGLLGQGLEDIPVSRARLSWAIPFPRPTADGERQATWVWFDALPNYLTATGYPAAGFEARWPAQLHVIGKDITRHHCVVWPAMLEAAGLPLPERVWAHGFIGLGGERFSKSAGVKLDLGTAIDRYGPDAFRYFLLREIPFDGDGDFSMERFDERYVADLADAFGNLASRVLAMLERYRGGAVPARERRPASTAPARTRCAGTPRPWTPSSCIAARRPRGSW